MDKEKILEILSDRNFWKKDIDTGILRENYLDKLLKFIKINKVISIVGVRREKFVRSIEKTGSVLFLALSQLYLTILMN